MEILNPLAEHYAEQFTTPDDDLLKEVAAFTVQTHPKAHMLSGVVQGRLLKLLVHMINPQNILEIGTFTGYSALCMAKALRADGEIHTIELRAEDAASAEKFFNKSGIKEKIHLYVGNALEIIPRLQKEWDLVFIDADKVSYTAYYDLVIDRVRKGGYILADNVLFHGQVLNEKKEGKNAKAIHAFNEYVKNDSRVECVLLTVRDGLLLIRKK
ncbi:MAG: class I SAM-dependent methyltransferase [Chitinophagaceae bacterium]|nr:class I SAM-dependent methyltransferase [Chitinophagaceae bacterium]